MRRLGVLGGGQLGRMLVQQATCYPLIVTVLDPDASAPCRPFCEAFTVGDFWDAQEVLEWGKPCEVVTIEIENISLDGLKFLQEHGVRVVPEPEALEIILDKGLQKKFYQDLGLATVPFLLADTPEAIRQARAEGYVFQKLRRSGYDGYGVRDLEKSPVPLEGPSVMEQKIEIAAELAVLAARDIFGNTVTYPVVDMVFHPQAHRLSYQLCPSSLPDAIQEEARDWATAIIENLAMTGLLAVEFLLGTDGRLWVNECAPRPHNSGHHTIEAFDISQFDMLLRIVQEMPVRQPYMRFPSALVNILGAPGAEGVPDYAGFLKSTDGQGVFIHLYGKNRVKPLRKMGHLTLVDSRLELLVRKAAQLAETAYIHALS